MFLKRLEVIGFKSFADRIGIDFVPGVTAVVGPNGSGKSNVTDAIRWVLGEQSAKSLRGAKMEDVIFAGSDSRKPLNFAEVSLILDNEDERLPIPYNEVSVTRRVYRSGDSEYLLNKQQCRLKDITDLFLDSGLGKEAFSIISQGRVDEILNSRPDDRRSIFEEAAGVLKYKQRKKKAEHKLFETEDNLHRVLDILHELDTRIEPLQIQASAAADYLKMSKELKDIDIAVIVHDLHLLQQSLATIVDEKKQFTVTEQEHTNNMENKEKQVATIRKQITALDSLLDQAQHQLVEASSEAERWEGRKVLMAEKRHNASAQLEKLQQSLEKAQIVEQEWYAQQVDKQEQLTERQTAFQQLKKSVKQLEDNLNRSTTDIENDIEDWKNTYIDRLNEQATVKNEYKHITQQLEQQEQASFKMTNQSSEMAEELEQLTKEQRAVESKLRIVQEQLESKLAAYSACQLELTDASKQFESKQDMLFKGYQHLQQLKSRKETLAELEADFSGFFHGVKEILIARESNKLSGIHGAVAELIQVSGENTKALETALGAASQHIVTETQQDAQKAIAWLKEKRAGRATFLPKNVMKSRKVSLNSLGAAASHPSFINTADELATFDTAFQTIAENLLGNVLVAKDLQGATQIAKSCNYRYRVVTLDGDVVNTGGSLTGGSAKQQTSLFSRKAELEALTGQLAQLQTTIEQAEKVVAEQKTFVATQTVTLENLRQQGEMLRNEEFELSGHFRELEATTKRLALRVTLVATEQEDATGRSSNLQERQIAAKKRMQELTAELAEINATIEQLNVLKVQSETAHDALKEQYAEKRSELAVIQEQVSQLKQASEDVTVQYNKAHSEVNNITQEIQWLTNDESQNGPSDEEIIASITSWQQQKEELVTTIATSKEQRTTLQVTLDSCEVELKELQRVHKGLLDGLRNFDVKLSQMEFGKTALLEQLSEDYELSFEEAEREVNADVDVEISRKKVKLLKQSIAELGPVNLNAIEEFETVSERHTFLTEQRSDLMEAKETLHEAIREMDEEMTARFSETFFKIRDHFQVVFRELFGGGHADLQLLEQDNLLETGIDIVAQPPGKKLQNLSLLSGGERALTAIALLFAILKTRPVPFCILDEVEAALDESNVTRYSQYLKKFSQESQFIVITHRKGTMEGADVLYGITMQESGVSKLVSVKLEQEEPVLVGQRSE
ncbi:chromosome segregation protein SMC [Viridibacillus sp. YIM B01967]|uniref:Chromosome partition protein Smc n=1 Tax=Viridibacillus soli TaxID=2798301 RepID=A0ABS1H4T8_9BACL|nr:chromosome segregation protein SMC [Viridibacillus soli]MBK3494419.1 chromosome segregation protein SMC [Viridibacillus soli]